MTGRGAPGGRLPQCRQADDQQDRQRDEAALAERAGDRPRFDAAATYTCEATISSSRARAATAPVLQREGSPASAEHRERGPEEEAVMRRHQNLEAVRRVQVILRETCSAGPA